MINTAPTFQPSGRLPEMAWPTRQPAAVVPLSQPAAPAAARAAVPDLTAAVRPSAQMPDLRPAVVRQPGPGVPDTSVSPAAAPARLATAGWPERATPQPAAPSYTPPAAAGPVASDHDHPLPVRAESPSPSAPLMAIRTPSTAPAQVTRGPAGPGPYLPMEYQFNRDWSNEYGYVLSELGRVHTFIH